VVRAGGLVRTGGVGAASVGRGKRESPEFGDSMLTGQLQFWGPWSPTTCRNAARGKVGEEAGWVGRHEVRSLGGVFHFVGGGDQMGQS